MQGPELLSLLSAQLCCMPEQAALLVHYFKPATYAKGTLWQGPATSYAKLAWVTSGYVRIHATQTENSKERDVTQWITVPGYLMVDLAWFFGQGKARWTMTCLTEVQVLEIGRPAYEAFVNEHHFWRDLERKFLIRCFETIENRVFQLLSLDAAQRFLYLYNHAPDLINAVPNQYLASMLGMTPETFSRLRARLAEGTL